MSNYEENTTQTNDDYQQKMPSKVVYTIWLIVGFLTGILWGCLAIAPYSRMTRAIKDDNPYEAWANSKKVRMFALIGIVVNIVVILIQMGGRS